MVQRLGSPPHTRGKGVRISASCSSNGITPAHAGKRDPGLGTAPAAWDHPRTRGEKWTQTSARGTAQRDHPRTRGEKAHYFLPPFLVVGSPPHTRGKVHDELHVGGQIGDHPRTRGEKYGDPIRYGRPLGSPPHTRGKDTGEGGKVGGLGITPAHAGKSWTYAPLPSFFGDPPRTRGEKRGDLHRDADAPGSPPHTRGKVLVELDDGIFHRITPAHAGKRLNGSRF